MNDVKKYCPYCGNPLSLRKEDGRDRLFCGEEERFIYENPVPASTALVFSDEGEVLLVLRNREPGLNEWSLPGGFVETGESPSSAAARELEEETGIRAQGPSLVDVIFHESEYYGTSLLIMGYRFAEFEGELVAGDDAAEARFFPVGQLPRLAFESHQKLIDKCLG